MNTWVVDEDGKYPIGCQKFFRCIYSIRIRGMSVAKLVSYSADQTGSSMLVWGSHTAQIWRIESVMDARTNSSSHFYSAPPFATPSTFHLFLATRSRDTANW